MKVEDMAQSIAPTDVESVTPEQRQSFALAALATPLLARRFKISRAMRDRAEAADALATIEGQPSGQEWANDHFKTRGVVRRG